MICVTDLSHDLFREYDFSNKVTVDMTCGRGQDTLFLSMISKKVIAFDIQLEAIESTKTLLAENKCENVTLIHDTHESIDKYIHEEICGVMYNLGYLPHGEKTIKTCLESTMNSLKKVLSLLAKDGICILVIYQKHEGNDSMAIKHYYSTLSSHEFDVIQVNLINKELAPFIIKIIKLK